LFCARALKDVTIKNLASSDQSSTLSVLALAWHHFGVFRVLL